MLILYSLALCLVLVVGAPWWLFRMAASGKYREGLTERLGIIPQRLRTQSGPVLWIHAVSVGEILAASRLIDELTQLLAPSGTRVVISTTTRTGQRLARERFGPERVFYFSLDFAFAVRAWLRFLQPRALILLETEFWPRLLVECRRARIPVAVVNARISDRSWPRYRRLAFVWKHLLNSLAIVLAQTPLDAERLHALGAANVRLAGNLKYDIRTSEPAPILARFRENLPPATPVLVCGSTLAGEEELLLNARPPGIVTILAPRHPERFPQVAQLLRKRGVPFILRSTWFESPQPIPPGAVFLLDSIGELASVYALATAAFIGGSLIPAGGHNPLEPAQFAIPIAMGPCYENFRGIVDTLLQRDALRIVTPENLQPALAELLSADPATQAMGARAKEIFTTESGATQKAIDAILALLEAKP
ncbi:MAG: 3-deoxy-D-manno-octulosonic acid transferase, partial [Acidobacteriaceae bacterium]